MKTNDIASVAAQLFPRSRVGEFAPYWQKCFEYAQVNTPKRVAMFFAQCGHECAGFSRFIEGLNYSADRLAAVWPNRYATANGKPNKLALEIERRPVEIANRTYADRMGNGNILSGDGWRYRGRGVIQLTGKDNYREFNADLGKQLGKDFLRNPELLEYPEYGLYAAVWFWKRRRLNTSADNADIALATKIINGGSHGLKERKRLYEKAVQLLQ